MRIATSFLATFLVLMLLAGVLTACKRTRSPGENLDRALDKTGEAIKDAGEAIKPDK